MNYLSHLFLSENNEESIIGNLLGDFVKGKLTDNFSAGILKGIKTHRKVDSYTDKHPVVRETRRLISDERKKYAGVLVDIFFDHFLSVYWDSYSDTDYEEFIDSTYFILLKYRDIYPETGKILIPRIVEKDWLRKYRSFDGLKLVFERMTLRVKRQNPLVGSEAELLENYSAIEKNFELFFPDLIKYVEEIRPEL